jgi:hypothetical protein
MSSVAESDPGSEIRCHLTPGSGIRDPGSGMDEKTGSGMDKKQDPDPE